LGTIPKDPCVIGGALFCVVLILTGSGGDLEGITGLFTCGRIFGLLGKFESESFD
jgi:hypothetical protein